VDGSLTILLWNTGRGAGVSRRRGGAVPFQFRLAPAEQLQIAGSWWEPCNARKWSTRIAAAGPSGVASPAPRSWDRGGRLEPSCDGGDEMRPIRSTGPGGPTAP
jgi:hypothetical protein